VDFSKIMDERIGDAIAAGEFDNLPGKGKPLNGLDAYFAAPEDWRMGASMLKSAGFLPQEMQLLKEIEELKIQRAQTSEPQERSRLARLINEKSVEYSFLMEKNRRRQPK
jgi:hypothetical protein